MRVGRITGGQNIGWRVGRISGGQDIGWAEYRVEGEQNIGCAELGLLPLEVIEAAPDMSSPLARQGWDKSDMENEVTRLGIKIAGRKSKVSMAEGIWQAWQEARLNIQAEEKKAEAEKRKRDAAVEVEEGEGDFEPSRKQRRKAKVGGGKPAGKARPAGTAQDILRAGDLENGMEVANASPVCLPCPVTMPLSSDSFLFASQDTGEGKVPVGTYGFVITGQTEIREQNLKHVEVEYRSRVRRVKSGVHPANAGANPHNKVTRYTLALYLTGRRV